MSFSCQASSNFKNDHIGMTLLEVLLSISMLVVFTGVVAVVMQFTLRFFSAAESGEKNQLNQVSNGVLIDHQQIQMAMDQLVEVLSQPGISLERLQGKEPCSVSDAPSSCSACVHDSDLRCRNQIAFDFTSAIPDVACAPANPVIHWGLPMSSVQIQDYLPPGYRFCLWTTSQLEGAMDSEGKSTPGIYLLQALPEVLSASSLPTRRLFCRPRPFC